MYRNHIVMVLCTLWGMLHCLAGVANAFNFMPRASFVIRAPQDLKFNRPQTRSSYFGYTLVIRETRWVYSRVHSWVHFAYIRVHECIHICMPITVIDEDKRWHSEQGVPPEILVVHSWVHLHLCQQYRSCDSICYTPLSFPFLKLSNQRSYFRNKYTEYLFDSISALGTAPIWGHI